MSDIPIAGDVANRRRKLESLLSAQAANAKNPFDLKIPLFVYDSLMMPAILGKVLDIPEADIRTLLCTTSATLLDYRRHKVLGASFPAVVSVSKVDETTNSKVLGVLLWLRTDRDAEVLDAMERSMYSRTLVDVTIDEDARIQKAYVYVWKGERSDLSADDWDLEEFVNTSLVDWLRVTRRPWKEL